jgi:hypothetical protein
LFGIATVSDLRTLHETLDDLQARDSDMAHSLKSQVTYVQALDRNVRVNTEAISNLSRVMKDALPWSHDLQLHRDIAWLNHTIYNHSYLLLAIRQVEFALLQLTLQVDEMLAAVQYVMLGKLPINFIGPQFLYSILRNISLKLPDQYDMIVSPRLEDIHLF